MVMPARSRLRRRTSNRRPRWLPSTA
jgi:hypothetical protein